MKNLSYCMLALFSLLPSAHAQWKRISKDPYPYFNVEVKFKGESTLLAGISCHPRMGFAPSISLKGSGVAYPRSNVPTVLNYHTDHRKGTLQFVANAWSDSIDWIPQSGSNTREYIQAILAGKTFDFTVEMQGYKPNNLLFSVPTQNLKALMVKESMCVKLMQLL